MRFANFGSREVGDSAPDAVCMRSCRMSCETTKIEFVPKYFAISETN